MKIRAAISRGRRRAVRDRRGRARRAAPRRGARRAARGRRLPQRPDDEGGLAARRSRRSCSATRAPASSRAVGADVTAVRPGDHVVLSYRSCGACAQCAAGHRPYCRDFRTLNGDRHAPGRLRRPCAATARRCTGPTSASRASRRTRWPTSPTSWWSARRSTSAWPRRWAAASRPARAPSSTCSRRRPTRRWSCSAPAASGCRR